MFQGRTDLSLDSKGRLAMPVKYRDALTEVCAGQLVITADSPNYLLIYPKPEWTAIREELMRRSNAIPAIKKLQRLLVGNAQDTEIDGQGRILVSPELRAYVGLDKTVTLLGLEKKFELWDQAKLDEELKEPPAGVELGAALGDFSW